MKFKSAILFTLSLSLISAVLHSEHGRTIDPDLDIGHSERTPGEIKWGNGPEVRDQDIPSWGNGPEDRDGGVPSWSNGPEGREQNIPSWGNGPAIHEQDSPPSWGNGPSTNR